MRTFLPSRFARPVLAGLLLLAAWPAFACAPAGWTKEKLLGLRDSGFVVADAGKRDALAKDLLACLADPDPVLRDKVAFDALSTWLRGKQLSDATRASLLVDLLPRIDPKAADTDGFGKPFATLVLSEVARTDRIAAWMTPAQREQLVQAAATYVEGVRDYRGFDDREGWRHGVAHGADLLMQLALNPKLDKPQLDRLLAAATSQIAANDGHAYVFGESERLLRPVLFIAARGLHTPEEWTAWTQKLVDPAPMKAWSEAYSSQAGLARRHNLVLFLMLLRAESAGNADPTMTALAGGAEAGLKAL
ncbi:DUF2785 domain-containing protein [Arenimonas oryziterrae]|uniref:DUF2785 domain-containing protein n=1 Tax=Arenimonas oryziterrae DSM 21050 = YC6267 TaxID=1121015 RepID=A0A091AZJ2_9GAMM|nr:DUF2785 domain-containing protein [Arenimonas oryziterrae]KFN44856.1 hypothetical protein N789_02235 [Arenimonas oryziterrae DSM 21050 = YC6267]